MGAENLGLPGFDLRIVQPEASRYTDWALPARLISMHASNFHCRRSRLGAGIANSASRLSTDWTVRDSNAGGVKNFLLLHTCSCRPWGPPRPITNGNWLFPGSKEAGAWLLSATVSNALGKDQRCNFAFRGMLQGDLYLNRFRLHYI